MSMTLTPGLAPLAGHATEPLLKTAQGGSAAVPGFPSRPPPLVLSDEVGQRSAPEPHTLARRGASGAYTLDCSRSICGGQGVRLYHWRVSQARGAAQRRAAELVRRIAGHSRHARAPFGNIALTSPCDLPATMRAPRGRANTEGSGALILCR